MKENEPNPSAASDAEKLNIAKRAIQHVLNDIADDERKFYLLGSGTESYSQLTIAAAALFGAPVEQIRKDFVPHQGRYKRYCDDLDANERLLRFCREKGITENSIVTVHENRPRNCMLILHEDDSKILLDLLTSAGKQQGWIS